MNVYLKKELDQVRGGERVGGKVERGGRGEVERRDCCSGDGNIPYELHAYDMRPFNSAIGRND